MPGTGRLRMALPGFVQEPLPYLVQHEDMREHSQGATLSGTSMTNTVRGAPSIDVWFDFASAYSYPAAFRAIRWETRMVAPFRWRPFVLGAVFKEHYNDMSAIVPPVKWRYLMRDLQRICDVLDIPFREPSVFPRSGILAARVLLAADDAPWRGDFIAAVFRANFGEDRDISAIDAVGGILQECGADASELLAVATSAGIKERLRVNTAEALHLGIFGSPTFTVGKELFWGGDRLEEAMLWQKRLAKGQDPEIY
jgi:2-hydroxychromene-2-carboxylate isomerase